MDERRGGWGGLLALFRLIHKGHKTGFAQARGGKLFDPDEFPFLEGRASKDNPARILAVSDGCLLRILEGLMTPKLRGAERERLSYRALDVEQIGSVYETVMGFTVEAAESLKTGEHPLAPFHWEIEFPEVFERDNGGIRRVYRQPSLSWGNADINRIGP